MKYLGQSDYQHATVPRIGILLTNLGTPEAPTAKALRPYLKQFLWDPRVVEVPRPIWWLILNGIILNTRPKRSAEAYSAVWNERGSPLLAHLEDQVEGVSEHLKARHLRTEKEEQHSGPFAGDTAPRAQLYPPTAERGMEAWFARLMGQQEANKPNAEQLAFLRGVADRVERQEMFVELGRPIFAQHRSLKETTDFLCFAFQHGGLVGHPESFQITIRVKAG